MTLDLNFKERIIQFGEGNFLRAFVDWMVQEMNEKAGFDGNVVVVQPIPKGMVDQLNHQHGKYHVILKGIKNGTGVKEIKEITSISRGINPYTDYQQFLQLAESETMRFIVSNTTEAGIAFNKQDTFEMQPPSSFPAKITQLLYHRYLHFNGDPAKGFIILPCELIENNAGELKRCVMKYGQQWNLPAGFINWVEQSNTFCNTLVDRIVPGFNKDSALELAQKYHMQDNLCVDAEQFYLWVIEGPQWIKNELPTEKAGLNVLVVDDVRPYRTRKVRLLNGPHTLMTPVAYLAGIEYVRETIEHPVLGKFVAQTIQHEMIPTIELPVEALQQFANEVIDRFRNPFVNHALMSISLNSVSKFKSRLLPTLLAYNDKFGKLPPNIVFSLAALIVFYKGTYRNRTIAVNDDKPIMEFFEKVWSLFDGNYQVLAGQVLANEAFWGTDLTKVEHLEKQVANNIRSILEEDIMESIRRLVR